MLQLDPLRTSDQGVIASFGGAVASGLLYSGLSGTDVYAMSLYVTPASGGYFGAIRLLDGTTQRTAPITVAPTGASGNNILATQIIPLGGMLFQSNVFVETVSGFFPATGGSGLFAGGLSVVVQVDPRWLDE